MNNSTIAAPVSQEHMGLGSLGSVMGPEKLNADFCKLAMILWLCAFFCAPAVAVDPHQHISQYAHTAWRVQEGAFSDSPIVITQTTDGYLWIGTNLGLVRFDGVRFDSWSAPPGQRLLDPRVFSLLGAHDGSLWIGTGYSISHWKDGKLTNYPNLSGRIESIAEDSDGTVWLVRTQATDPMGPLCRIKDDRLQCYGAKDGIPFSMAIYLNAGMSKELWIGGYSELCRWTLGSSETYFAGASRNPETFASLRAVATAPDGSVWAAIDRSKPVFQLEHFDHGIWNSRNLQAITADTNDVTALFVDRDNALWVGTAHHGIFRVWGNDIDHFGSAEGLTSDAVGRFYQDKEGIVWVVTSDGIDSFHDLQVTRYSKHEGLSAAGASSVVASHDGTIWIANFKALDFLRDGKISALREGQGLPGSNVTTLFEDHAGRLWAGIDAGLWVNDGAGFRPIHRTDGSALGIVFAITEDTHHSIWARAGTKLVRIDDLRVTGEFSSPQISTAYVLAANPKGGIFLGLVNGDLVQYENGKTQTFASNEVENTRQIRDLLVEPDGSVWGTTLDEVARWKNGVRKNLTTRNGLPCDGIFALINDRQDSLWLYSRCGLVSIEKSQLDKWWEDPRSQIKFTLFDVFDGVQAGLTSLKPQAVRSPDGRLWFVNGSILQSIDPGHLRKNAIQPPVQIEEILADRQSFLPGNDLRLPALTQDLEIRYTALSFTAPQKVRFRYKLEGRDADWQEPGTRREAFYNDLHPGKYRFRVTACNNDGVWNEAGAAIEFTVAPAFYQTKLFLLLCVAGAACFVWAAYFWRVRSLKARLNMQFHERLSERTRIAQELHDTLLQGVLSASMQLHVANDQIADDAPFKPLITRVLELMGGVVNDGRSAVRGLRVTKEDSQDLQQAFSRIPQEIAIKREADFRVIIEGTPRTLHPMIRDEVYRIGREAVTNAFRHSQATSIEVELEYGTHELRVLVRDNGRGIDPQILQSGREGHWGLSGMRERAERAGAKLKLWSNATSGTEVELRVPGRIAFGSQTLNGTAKWLAKIYPRKTDPRSKDSSA